MHHGQRYFFICGFKRILMIVGVKNRQELLKKENER